MIDLRVTSRSIDLYCIRLLHPLLADVPHHNRKLQAERALVDSGLNYTILQPSRYMQHLTKIWKTVLATGVHSMPFDTRARFSLVDLADLAEAVRADRDRAWPRSCYLSTRRPGCPQPG
jgi:uncharacterized protein YbjT (DUF2867 family)